MTDFETNPMLILSIIFICLYVYPFGLLLCDKIMNTHLSCKQFGWHNGKNVADIQFDGCSKHAICSKCGKEVMQDSQGNWF